MSVFQMSISAAILIAAIVIIRGIFIHKLPKAIFVILWAVVLLRLLMPFSVSIPALVSNQAFSVNTFVDDAASIFNTYEHGMHFAPWGTHTAISSTIPADGVIANLNSLALVAGTSENRAVFFTLTTVWLVGMVVAASFFLGTHLRYRKEYKGSLPIDCDMSDTWLKEQKLMRSIQIRQSDRINTPLTYGIWRPVILFSKTASLTDERLLQYILTHELIHIKRFDILKKWLLAIAVCIHWFNPLVWVMYMLANRDIELSCDEAVVKSLGEKTKPSYALALIRLEESRSIFTPIFSNFAKNGIEERINAIMKVKKTSMVTKFAAFMMVLIFILTACSAMAQEPVEIISGTISVGLTSSFKVESDGTLWAWGSNERGQLGDGTTEERYAHQSIMANVSRVSAGSMHTFAITTDNMLYAWGENSKGQLGDSTNTIRYSPVRVLDDVIYVAAGANHTMAIRADGSLWAWGSNEYGQLGDGTKENNYTPIKVMEDVILASAGAYHTMAIRSDGSLWAWGRNHRHQLGDGGTENQPLPIQITEKENTALVSAGDYHTVALMTDGSLWSWGWNMSGQLGDGTREASPVPIKIMDNAVYTSAGEVGTAAITSDGNLWAWGGLIRVLEPHMIMNNVVAVSLGAGDIGRSIGHVLIIRTDGSLWSWGANRSGQLGIGQTRQNILPSPVMVTIGELPGYGH